MSGPINKARDSHKYRHKLGQIGPSNLLSELGDLSVFIVIFETVLGREHPGKVLQSLTATLIFEESP